MPDNPIVILIADDDPDIRLLLDFNLSKDGHKVLEATNGAEASINAIQDAGLTKEDIDGLICCRHFKPLKNEAEITPYLVAQRGVR